MFTQSCKKLHYIFNYDIIVRMGSIGGGMALAMGKCWKRREGRDEYTHFSLIYASISYCWQCAHRLASIFCEID